MPWSGLRSQEISEHRINELTVGLVSIGEQHHVQALCCTPHNCMPETDRRAGVKVDSLTLVAPLMFNGRKAHVCVGGRPQDYVEANVLAGQYAMFTADTGPQELRVTVKYGE